MDTPRNGAAGRFAPGMRGEIRAAEWPIKRIDHASDGGYAPSCEGLSALVGGREGVFLSKLEAGLRILDRRQIRRVSDTSSNFGASLLYIDSLLRQSMPSAIIWLRGSGQALDASRQIDAAKRKRREAGQRHIERTFADYRNRLDNTQTREREPYIQVGAAFTGMTGTEGV